MNPFQLNIIVVEDHDMLREDMVQYLARPDWFVRGVANGVDLDTACDKLAPHLLVLDLNLPGEDGISIAQRMKKRYEDIGIVMLTARTLHEDRAVGYGSGADVYLNKPANVGELESVIFNLARRLGSRLPPSATAVFSRERMTIRTPDGKYCRLSTNERRLLEALLGSRERKMSYEELVGVLIDAQKDTQKMDQDEADDGMETSVRHNLTVILSRLRAKLRTELDLPELLQTLRGYGYRLTSDVVVEP